PSPGTGPRATTWASRASARTKSRPRSRAWTAPRRWRWGRTGASTSPTPATSASAASAPTASSPPWPGRVWPGSTATGCRPRRPRLTSPPAVAVGRDGSLSIADTGTHRIRRVAPDGTITTVAGNGTEGFSPDGTIASQAALRSPAGVGRGPDGIVYFSDTGNN